MNDEYSSGEDNCNLSLDDYLSNTETENILENRFCNKFNDEMYDKIITFYENEVDDAKNNFIDVLDKDLKNKGSDLFHIIYKNISKKYDIRIFDQFPSLANSLFEKKKIKIVEKPDNAKFDSKKFNWGTKI
mgnify:CR=1 FL=1|tara:strand:+ start:963 stop:1355 length:393 start_codon:yes stop_codon:yes gene_type:complete